MEQFVNFAVINLAAVCLIGDTQITVTNPSALPTSGTYRLLIDNEIMVATSRSGAIVQVVRATEGTSAAAHSLGEQVYPIDTAAQAAQARYDAATMFPREIIFNTGMSGTSSSFFTSVGGRSLDLSLFPSTLGTLTRTVTFIATLTQTSGATSAKVQLYNIEDASVITGSLLNNSAAPFPTLPFDVSAVLPVGTSPGDLRSDVADQYQVQIAMVGGTPPSDQAIITNARLVITYA
jgi:hypothetical protein